MNQTKYPTRPEPSTSRLTQPFWDATRGRKFLLQHCLGCKQVVQHPREMCPHCGGTELSWKEASGRGTVYAASVMHKPASPMFARKVPYVVAIIELEEGGRMMSNVVGCEPSEVRVGMPVQVTWEEMSDGRSIPLFEPRA
jgi:hypothetical protein